MMGFVEFFFLRFLVSPKSDLDATYSEVFAVERALNIKHPLRKPPNVWYPAFQAAIMTTLVDGGLARVVEFSAPMPL